MNRMMRNRRRKGRVLQGKRIKDRAAVLGMLLLMGALLGGCSGSDGQEAAVDTEVASEDAVSDADSAEDAASDTDGTESAAAAELADGVYTAKFTTDSTMFHVNEEYDDMGTLTVENGEMTIHITLGSKKILNLYPGLAEDAQKDGAQLLEPTLDTVTYSDGMTEEVYGFDVPVPYLDEEFDLALIGTKETWYDHKVSVSDPVPLDEAQTQETEDGLTQDGADENETADSGAMVDIADLADGSYTIEFDFEGGSGKASITSPAPITVSDGTVTATLEWSSPNYDYMIVNGETYLPVNTEGNSVFEIPVSAFDEPVTVIGDTVAMSKPHEIEYTLTFHSATLMEVMEDR